MAEKNHGLTDGSDHSRDIGGLVQDPMALGRVGVAAPGDGVDCEMSSELIRDELPVRSMIAEAAMDEHDGLPTTEHVVPPAEAEERYYAMLKEPDMAA